MKSLTNLGAAKPIDTNSERRGREYGRNGLVPAVRRVIGQGPLRAKYEICGRAMSSDQIRVGRLKFW